MSFLGIDIGTQSLKVIVAAEDLSIVGSASASYSVDHPRPGWAEQSADDWERALGTAVAGALAQAGLHARDLRGIGVSGQLDGCVPTDEDGRALGPCLIWMDRRAQALMPVLPDDFRARTGVVADPGHMAAKVAWLHERSPAPRYHQPVSYLVHRLTGVPVFDPSLASTTMVFELGASELSDELCTAFGIRRQWLPAVAPAHDVAGLVREQSAAQFGLWPGTPVVVGTGDDFATPLGAGLVAPGRMACVLGTAEVVGSVCHDQVVDDLGLLQTHPYPGGRYFIENPGWLAGGGVAWIRDLLGFRSDAALDAAAAAAPPGCNGLTFIPALTGAMAPRWRPNGRGAFYGLSPSHGRGEMARALLEGCGFAMRDVQERLTGLGPAPASILALGGGAASSLWLQIRADLSGLPVSGSSSAHTCALGAAILACCGVDGGELAELANNAPRAFDSIDPQPELKAGYDEAYRRYRQLFDALEPLML